jgi:hypothetical protein
MRQGTGTRASSIKAGEALSKSFAPSFVPWREDAQGHIPPNRRVPTPHPSGVKDPVSELIDHTLYIDNTVISQAYFFSAMMESMLK